MKVIDQYYKFVNETDPLKKIELCGRVCYKSEDKITDDSAERFIKVLIRRGHESVLEHANIIINVSVADYVKYVIIRNSMMDDGKSLFLKSTVADKGDCVISGNVRAWRDFIKCCNFYQKHPSFLNLLTGVLFDDINYDDGNRTCSRIIDKSDLKDGIKKDVHWNETVRFVVDRGVSHEIVRHRVASFSQESTRYVKYNDNNMTFIKPCFFDESSFKLWQEAMINAENSYNSLLASGATAQEARSVLPNSTKTELIMTANLDCWKNFFDLRTDVAAHPQMREIAIPLKEAFIKKGLI